MKQREPKKTKVLIAVSPPLLEKIDARARAENRTRSNYIEFLMMKDESMFERIGKRAMRGDYTAFQPPRVKRKVKK